MLAVRLLEITYGKVQKITRSIDYRTARKLPRVRPKILLAERRRKMAYSQAYSTVRKFRLHHCSKHCLLWYLQHC